MSDDVFFTKKDLLYLLENIEDDTRFAIRAQGELFFDVELSVVDDDKGEVLVISCDELKV